MCFRRKERTQILVQLLWFGYFLFTSIIIYTYLFFFVLNWVFCLIAMRCSFHCAQGIWNFTCFACVFFNWLDEVFHSIYSLGIGHCTTDYTGIIYSYLLSPVYRYTIVTFNLFCVKRTMSTDKKKMHFVKYVELCTIVGFSVCRQKCQCLVSDDSCNL